MRQPFRQNTETSGMRDSRKLNYTSPRTHLVLLQVTALILYWSSLQAFAITRLQVGIILGLSSLALLLLTIPRAYLTRTWIIGSVVLGNIGAIYFTMRGGSASALSIGCTLILLTALASYANSAHLLCIVDCVIIAAYGFFLHHFKLWGTDAVLILPVLLCLILTFFTKTRSTQAQLQRLTETEEITRNETMIDALTGLPNRAQFVERVSRSIQCCRNDRGFQFAILFIDLDNFKPINDKLGHKAGDAVLRHTAKRIQGCLRKGDIVGRYGGDEFTLLLNNVNNASDTVYVANRVLAKLQEPINAGELVKVGASIGIALSTNLHETPEELIRDADAAMYRAKAKGKNRFAISDQSVDIPKSEIKERWKRAVGLR